MSMLETIADDVQLDEVSGDDSFAWSFRFLG